MVVVETSAAVSGEQRKLRCRRYAERWPSGNVPLFNGLFWRLCPTVITRTLFTRDRYKRRVQLGSFFEEMSSKRKLGMKK